MVKNSMISNRYIIIAALLTCASSAPSWAMGRSLRNHSEVRVHSTVTHRQLQLMRTDIARLGALTFTDDPTNVETARLMGLPKLGGTELIDWTHDRIHTIVGENFPAEDHAAAQSRSNWTYPNGGELPLIESASHTASSGQIGMSNIGAGIYLKGKRESTLYEVELSPIHRVQVISPRAGILKIGEALFSLRYSPNLERDDAVSNSIHRLATLFHEARHSDGNGKSLSFFHAVCAAGIYQGLAACDRNLNGPYTIQARTTQAMAENCKSQSLCTDQEMESLRLEYLDSFSRVIETTPIGDDNIEQDLAKVTETLRACEQMSPDVRATMMNLCGDLPGLERRIAQLREALGRGIPSTEWDATPEATASPRKGHSKDGPPKGDYK